jgi:hypothetical protein
MEDVGGSNGTPTVGQLLRNPHVVAGVSVQAAWER